jgi:hypothetical protein
MAFSGFIKSQRKAMHRRDRKEENKIEELKKTRGRPKKRRKRKTMGTKIQRKRELDRERERERETKQQAPEKPCSYVVTPGLHLPQALAPGEPEDRGGTNTSNK